jgi:tRNA 2-thiouridine synthesizing protein D
MTLRFAIVVSGPAYGTQASSSAYRFTQAVLAAGHSVVGVFFYQEGVLNASYLHAPASDEIDLHYLWCELAIEHQIHLHVCIAAAQRRGILDVVAASEATKDVSNVKTPFLLSGLGQLAEMLLTADRVVRF